MQTVIAKSCKKSKSRQPCQESLGTYISARTDDMLVLFQAVLLDAVDLIPSYRKSDSAIDFRTISNRLRKEGPGFITVTLPSLMSSLFAHVEGGSPTYAFFKLQKGAEYPRFLNRLFKVVYEDVEDSAEAFGFIYQISTLFKKLNGPYRDGTLERARAKFIETDQEIGFRNYNSEVVKPIIDEARKLIETVLEDVKLTPGALMPRPGPGATNTPVEPYERYEPRVIFDELNEEFDYLEYFYPFNIWDPHVDAKRYMSLESCDVPYSRYKNVPKYLDKPRGMCIEENEQQFFQQAVKRLLYRILENHPLTKGRVNFSSQDINRCLALSSSSSGLFATLDMSEASDRNARELVYRLTWNTAIADCLMALSTKIVSFAECGINPRADQIYHTQKFATMGSGICFPIEAILHWALICAIIKLSALEDSDTLMQQVYVYGDDIIIPTQAVQAVYDYLPLFGMKFNTDKSFRYGLFRESCGIHAYNGVDVTPVYVNYITNNSTSVDDTRVLLSLIAKEADFFKKGYYETARCVRMLVRKHFWLLPTVGSASSVLGFKRDRRSSWRSVIKSSRRSRYNEDIQSPEYDLQVVVRRSQKIYEMRPGQAYLRKLLTNAENPGTMFVDLDDLKIVRRWVPLSAI